MNSVEFGKKCRPHNIKYRDIFGYVPLQGRLYLQPGRVFWRSPKGNRNQVRAVCHRAQKENAPEGGRTDMMSFRYEFTAAELAYLLFARKTCP